MTRSQADALDGEAFSDAPVFGERVAGAKYVPRPSVYALLVDTRGAVLLVRTPKGFFLPGGGVEADETWTDGLVREVREECGLVVEPGSLVARAKHGETRRGP